MIVVRDKPESGFTCKSMEINSEMYLHPLHENKARKRSRRRTGLNQNEGGFGMNWYFSLARASMNEGNSQYNRCEIPWNPGKNTCFFL